MKSLSRHMTEKNCGKKYHLVHCLLLRVSMQRVCFSSSKYLVFIFCLLALLQAWNIKAQPNFATYKPHLHNRDSLMVFYDRIFYYGCWIDSNRAFKITDSISLYAKAQGNENCYWMQNFAGQLCSAWVPCEKRRRTIKYSK
jgi:hypothetical protein